MAKTAEEIKAQLRAQREVEAKKDLSTVPALAKSYASAEALKDSEAREKRIKSAPCAENDATDSRGRVQSFSTSEGADASCSATGPITSQPKGAAQNRPRVTARAGKDMPHSTDAEKGILCGILQRPAVVVRSRNNRSGLIIFTSLDTAQSSNTPVTISTTKAGSTW